MAIFLKRNYDVTRDGISNLKCVGRFPCRSALDKPADRSVIKTVKSDCGKCTVYQVGGLPSGIKWLPILRVKYGTRLYYSRVLGLDSGLRASGGSGLVA